MVSFKLLVLAAFLLVCVLELTSARRFRRRFRHRGRWGRHHRRYWGYGGYGSNYPDFDDLNYYDDSIPQPQLDSDDGSSMPSDDSSAQENDGLSLSGDDSEDSMDDGTVAVVLTKMDRDGKGKKMDETALDVEAVKPRKELEPQGAMPEREAARRNAAAAAAAAEDKLKPQ